jgi:hypothetical protein
MEMVDGLYVIGGERIYELEERFKATVLSGFLSEAPPS